MELVNQGGCRYHVQLDQMREEMRRRVGNVEKSKQLSAEALRVLPPNSPLWREAARTAMMAGASAGRHRDG